VKSTVYSAEASNMQDLKQRIENGCGMIRTKHGIFSASKKNIVQMCHVAH
jgi:hypothetical protein